MGRKLYEALEQALNMQHILNVNACITYIEKEDEYVTKNSAQFHEHMGYRLVGKFCACGYKFGRWYDMDGKILRRAHGASGGGEEISGDQKTV